MPPLTSASPTDTTLRERKSLLRIAYRAANPDLVKAQKKASYERHREKYRESQRNYYAKNRAKIRASQKPYKQRIRYGLTPLQYAEMFSEQKGLCQICLLRPIQHIDHDHRSGVVRGLLCGTCNQGLGYFHDEPGTLRAAATYLEEHK